MFQTTIDRGVQKEDSCMAFDGCQIEISDGNLCGRSVFAQGMCAAHYKRLYRSGDSGEEPVREYRTGEATCSEPGCTNERVARGLCAMHHSRLLRTGGLEKKTVQNKGRQCSEPGCEKGAARRGLCWNHYERSRGRYPGWQLRGKEGEKKAHADNGS